MVGMTAKVKGELSSIHMNRSAFGREIMKG